MSQRRRSHRGPTVTVNLTQGRTFAVPARFPGEDPAERIFGPAKPVLAERGETKLTDEKEHASRRLDARSRPAYAEFEELYQFAGGGILGFIAKKRGEAWTLSVVMSRPGQFSEPRPDGFPAWQAAWAYVAERL